MSLEERKPSPDRPLGRVLGLDVGSRRIGLAISDPLGITAQGLETLQRRNKRQDLAALEHLIHAYAVREIVVGLPLRMSGAEGTQSEKMQAFADDLRKRFRLPVHLWDERLTSAEANRLLRETELSIEKRAKAVDRMAAVLILQAWMEKRLQPYPACKHQLTANPPPLSSATVPPTPRQSLLLVPFRTNMFTVKTTLFPT